MSEWQPGASIEILRRRAGLLSDIRSFFSERGVLEVETPLLAASTATDVHIQSLSVPAKDLAQSFDSSGHCHYLQTSPEFAMKRLLAAGMGPVFQICKAFRQDERTPQHNTEFSLLEWYRPGFSMERLMDEVEALIVRVLGDDPVSRVSYRQLFQQHLGFDPHEVSSDELKQHALSRIDISTSADDLDDTDYLQLLMSQCIEPMLPALCIVYDYPVAQAALSRIQPDETGQPVAKRFELYCGGMELANGYFELIDAKEQRKRFESDLDARKSRGLELYPVDEKLLAAMDSGLPECAGVALGIDRLLMAVTGINDIRQVLVFTSDQA